MNIKALIAFNAANELANDIYECQQSEVDIAWSVIEQYNAYVVEFETLSGCSFAEKRQEYLEITGEA